MHVAVVQGWELATENEQPSENISTEAPDTEEVRIAFRNEHEFVAEEEEAEKNRRGHENGGDPPKDPPKDKHTVGRRLFIVIKDLSQDGCVGPTYP